MAGLTNKQNKPDKEAQEKELEQKKQEKERKKQERAAQLAAVKSAQETAAREAAKDAANKTAKQVQEIAALRARVDEQAALLAQQKDVKGPDGREEKHRDLRPDNVYDGPLDEDNYDMGDEGSLSSSESAPKSHKKRKAVRPELDDTDFAVIQQRLTIAAQGLKAEDLHVITAKQILGSMTEAQKDAYGAEWKLNMSKKNNTDMNSLSNMTQSSLSNILPTTTSL
jgi:hypothetical protein